MEFEVYKVQHATVFNYVSIQSNFTYLSLSISVRSLGHNESVIDSALFLIGSVYFVAGKLLLKSGISVGRSPSSGFESLI